MVILERGTSLVLYAEPGVQRVRELRAQDFPILSSKGESVLTAVAVRKVRWIKVAYDDAGREGWVEAKRSWPVLSWSEFLPGRSVRILPGLKKPLYLLHREPGEKGEEAGVLTREQAVRVDALKGDWARIDSCGWFRWRDGDGRLTVSLEGDL